MLALYVLFPRGESEEIIAAPSDLIEAESPQLSETPTLNNETETMKETEPVNILIEIKGHVQKPGVFELPAESRLHMAIDLAGGFLPEADALSLNMAMKLTDEMSVYVPEIGETVISPPVIESPVPSAAGPSGGGLININTADEAGLATLPGIGPSKAAAIIAYREEQGPFATIDALKDVTGIGDKTFEQLKDSISIN
ncbi:helix-hairpin-helix domain-containing protein [Planococcus halotolerans]|uniref:Competence protein ComEA n=1 Tax=Planococcus halotolerans TaxID=2233542 RepID=A0A365KTW7_9BACL|nr:helix-hairpin-helix domain-containing protein [Planococcus halotolerans]QHJ71525.1 competence protein ComEA [Planococcus halotolerans]RAZ76620.1 competence protein ComEA [Planococcus halotolerans]